jgi:hypothetical protein
MAVRKKSADLSVGLVAVKGSALPAPDTATRAADDEGEGRGTPLNFRVSPVFRREFKTYAAQHDMKLIELLQTSFEFYIRHKSR